MGNDNRIGSHLRQFDTHILSVRPSSFLFLAYEKLNKSTDAMFGCTEHYETALEKTNSSLATENASLVNDSHALDRPIRE